MFKCTEIINFSSCFSFSNMLFTLFASLLARLYFSKIVSFIRMFILYVYFPKIMRILIIVRNVYNEKGDDK